MQNPDVIWRHGKNTTESFVHQQFGLHHYLPKLTQDVSWWALALMCQCSRTRPEGFHRMKFCMHFPKNLVIFLKEQLKITRNWHAILCSAENLLHRSFFSVHTAHLCKIFLEGNEQL